MYISSVGDQNNRHDITKVNLTQSATSSNFMEDLESMTDFNQACMACEAWSKTVEDPKIHRMDVHEDVCI